MRRAFFNMNKTKVRCTLLNLRKNLSAEQRLEYSVQIQSRVLTYLHWQEAKSVALYVAVKNEVSTDILLEEAWAKQKKVFLPRCCPMENQDTTVGMDFVLCHSRAELRCASFGLMEPIGQILADEGNLPDLVIVPVVGLSPEGTRIGYGGGYYDRAFSRPLWQDIPRLALAYSCQIQTFEADVHDIAVNAYATEKRFVCL